MNKYLPFFALLLLGVMVFGTVTSGAYFSDQDVQTGNAINLGVLDPRWQPASPFVVQSAQPGVVAGTQELTFFSDPGTTSLDIKYRLSATHTGGSVELYELIWVTAEVSTDSGRSWRACYNGWLKNLDIHPGNCNAGWMAKMSPNYSAMWRFTYTPAASIGNNLKGESVDFAIIADSTQASNPGW